MLRQATARRHASRCAFQSPEPPRAGLSGPQSTGPPPAKYHSLSLSLSFSISLFLPYNTVSVSRLSAYAPRGGRFPSVYNRHVWGLLHISTVAIRFLSWSPEPPNETCCPVTPLPPGLCLEPSIEPPRELFIEPPPPRREPPRELSIEPPPARRGLRSDAPRRTEMSSAFSSPRPAAAVSVSRVAFARRCRDAS